MYDKYLQGNTFATSGALLPKHKGFLMINGTASALGATFYFVNKEGNTLAAGAYFASGSSIFPCQVYGVSSLAVGLTGFLLN